MLIERRVRQNEGVVDGDFASTLAIKRSAERQACASIHCEPKAPTALPKEVTWREHCLHLMLHGKPSNLANHVG